MAHGDTTHNVQPSHCGMGPGYSQITKEWSSIGFREGFADFISAAVYNDKSGSGTLHRLGLTWDLERWDASNTPYGYLRNVCCPPGDPCAHSLSGAATRIDWALAFWDIFTDTNCDPKPSHNDMLRFFRETMEALPTDDDEYFPASVDAMAELVSGGHVGSCFNGRWAVFSCHNGIDYVGILHPDPHNGYCGTLE